MFSLVRTRARVLGAVSLVAVLGATVSAPYARGAAEPSPGSAGVGDPYFPEDGNGGINVLHYDVHDTYAFASGVLSGHTRLKIRATQSLSRFNLDLLLPVSAVKVDGVRAAYSKPNKHELRITPRTPVRAGDVFSVLVRYRGKPGPISYENSRSWLANRTEVVTMNEPHMAPWWFPANDHPTDKASFDIHITVPAGREVVSNGRLVGRKVRDGQATTHWRAAEPMATYLAFFAAGDFATRKGSLKGRPWYVAVSKQLPAGQRSGLLGLMRKSPHITAWLENQLGRYPFSTTGGVVTSLPVGFALENQTRPTYPAVSLSSTALVVHELAHQWFGNSVSVRRWSDIWLNEGFATFLEVRYAETHGGPSGGAWLRDRYDAFADDNPFWDVRIGAPGSRHLFDNAVYERGAMAVQALRNRVGETDFWRILRGWVQQRRYGNGSVADFRAYAAAVSGEDLGPFFSAWLNTTARPADTAANGLR